MLSRDLRNPWFLRDGIPEDSDRKTGQKWTWWRVGDPVRCQVDDRGKPLPARRSGRRIRRAMSSGLSKKRRGGTSGRFPADSRDGGELAKKWRRALRTRRQGWDALASSVWSLTAEYIMAGIPLSQVRPGYSRRGSTGAAGGCTLLSQNDAVHRNRQPGIRLKEMEL